MNSAASFRQQLADHELTRPEWPRPFLKDSPEGIAFHRAFTLWADEKCRLTHKITLAECPIDFGKRQDRPVAALPARASRMQ